MKQRKGWWVDIANKDGSKSTVGPFSTYQEAYDYGKYSVGLIAHTIEYRVTYTRKQL